MELYQEWTQRLQKKLQQALQEAFNEQWGHNASENEGMLIDLLHELESIPEDHLLLQDRLITETGIELYVLPGEELRTIRDIQEAIQALLTRASERFLLLLPLLDETHLTFWFATGGASHGHIGRIMIPCTAIAHMDLSYFNDSSIISG